MRQGNADQWHLMRLVCLKSATNKSGSRGEQMEIFDENLPQKIQIGHHNSWSWSDVETKGSSHTVCTIRTRLAHFVSWFGRSGHRAISVLVHRCCIFWGLTVFFSCQSTSARWQSSRSQWLCMMQSWWLNLIQFLWQTMESEWDNGVNISINTNCKQESRYRMFWLCPREPWLIVWHLNQRDITPRHGHNQWCHEFLELMKLFWYFFCIPLASSRVLVPLLFTNSDNFLNFEFRLEPN